MILIINENCQVWLESNQWDFVQNIIPRKQILKFSYENIIIWKLVYFSKVTGFIIKKYILKISVRPILLKVRWKMKYKKYKPAAGVNYYK